MSVAGFVERQVAQIKDGGYPVLLNKARLALQQSLRLPALILAVPIVLVARLIRPGIVLRADVLKASRIGHFAANTELYLCERDVGINVPTRRYADFFYLQGPVSNRQLAAMWRRQLRILPAPILASVCAVNRLIPGGAIHEIGQNTREDRDVHNLLDHSPPHLTFSAEEESRGEAGLAALGIAPGSPFVCLIVRDRAYLQAHMPGAWDYHNYRDSDIANYALAAEELSRRGYYVVRMGARVRQEMPVSSSRVIDYATDGARSDFMDIYLGAKCAFCISGNTGFDYVPVIFRRPVAYVNVAPLGYLSTFRARDISIVKHHFSVQSGRELSLREILEVKAGFCVRDSEYAGEGVRLAENTPEEIRDLVVEMAERLNGGWRQGAEDAALQARFRALFPSGALFNGRPLHGEIRARFGAAFLRHNRWWLDS